VRVADLREIKMKLIVECILALVLHPIAVILVWINLLGRTDLFRYKKFLWALISLVWGIGPILYVLIADGNLW